MRELLKMFGFQTALEHYEELPAWITVVRQGVTYFYNPGRRCYLSPQGKELPAEDIDEAIDEDEYLKSDEGKAQARNGRFFQCSGQYVRRDNGQIVGKASPQPEPAPEPAFAGPEVASTGELVL